MIGPAPALLALVAAGPPLATGTQPDIAWWRVLGALVFCLLAGLAAALLLRQRLGGRGLILGGGGRSRRLRLLERLPLGPQASIALVQVDDSEALVLIAPGATRLVRVDDLAKNSPGEAEQGE